ncbi:MAG: hypothetical protein HC884_14205 [Chloroflexaceae bacterium]|nr:hypothetical protein [Chloroflexaceae bacterium]
MGQGSAPTVREEFADTAYWESTITTDSDGRATVSVQLPDNLTTWVMRGVGLTFETQVGEGTAELIATKPLLIRPVTPRFLVVDDVVELAANVSNRTDALLEVQVGLATRGLTITGALTRTVQIGAGSEEKVTWEATVQDVALVDLVFQAVSGPYHDASRPTLATGPEGTLPVYRYSAPETVGTAGQMEGEGARTEVIALPPRLDERRGELTVRLDPSLAASMRDGLTYLEHYPYECTEQTVSRFLPNVLTVRALKLLGLNNPDLEDHLPALVQEGLNRLYQRQHGDGGWGWWDQVHEYSNPHISAYVVFGLLRTQEAGYQVRNEVLERGLDYLEQEAKATGSLTNPSHANLQAWLLYVLAEGERFAPDLLDDLYEHRDHAGVYGRALLAMALHTTAASDSRVQTLLSELQHDAILSATGTHWEEPTIDHWGMTTDTRSTAMVLSALVQLDPDHALNPNVVRWLMVARQGDRWETTQETAWAIMALTDWMVHTGELNADYDYAVWLNEPGSAASGDPQFAGHIGQDDVDEPVVLRTAVAALLNEATTWLTIGRGSGSGQLYYTAHLRTFLPVEDVQALDRGIIVRRRYTLASCTDGPQCPDVSAASVGDVMRVEVSVTAPNDLYYVVVEDPLPAGAEIINSSLATSAQDGNGQGQMMDRSLRPWYWWWWQWYSRSEFRDEKAVLFADWLPEGSYLYTYEIRATVPGTFHVIPTTANEFYFPEVSGRGEGQVMEIAP